jgi:peptidoglycan DL-endopeptidase CwlO
MKKLLYLLVTCSLLLLITPVQSTKAASGQQIVDLAKKYVGVPYKFGGTSPAGFDCSGFLKYVYGKFNINLPRTSSEQYKVGTKVSKSELEPGDIVLFSNTYKPGISHAGIYIGDNKFISAENKGIAISSLNNSYWGPKFTAGKRLDSVSSNKQFSDLATSHPAYDAVIELSSNNVINGFTDNTFKPEKPVTRGQAAAILNRVLEYTPSKNASFKDISPNQSFYKDILAMQSAGIIQGYPDGTFKSNQYMDRAQMAVIIERAFNFNHGYSIAKASKIYDDVVPNHWAGAAIASMHTIDKTTLFQTSSFRASDEATRAEFSAAIYSAYPGK